MSATSENLLVTELDLITKYWNLTEGRDKFSKAIQYGARFAAFHFAADKDLALRFTNLMRVTADARKIFRLGKSANEYMKIQELVKVNTADQLSRYANILCRASFLGYWVFDNLFILSKIGFLKGDQKAHNKKAASFWLIGLILSVFLELYKLHKVRHAEKLSGVTAKTSAEKTTIYQNVVKNVGDMVTASQGAEIPQNVLGHGWNEGALGAGGLISALITIYQQYPARPVRAAPVAVKDA